MTNDNHAERPADASIGELTERLEAIIAQLEDGEASLERMQELHSEGRAILENLRAELNVGEGTVELRE